MRPAEYNRANMFWHLYAMFIVFQQNNVDGGKAVLTNYNLLQENWNYKKLFKRLWNEECFECANYILKLTSKFR